MSSWLHPRESLHLLKPNWPFDGPVFLNRAIFLCQTLLQYKSNYLHKIAKCTIELVICITSSFLVYKRTKKTLALQGDDGYYRQTA